MTVAPEAPVEAQAPTLPVLIGLGEMVALFPVTQQTVYRWRVARGKSGPALPEPLLTVSGTPMWDEETVLEFARSRNLTHDRNVLRRIRKAQGRG